MYKGKYVIGIYELNGEETCVGLFDTVKDLAKFINKPVESTYTIVNHHFNSKNIQRPRKIIAGNNVYEIAFIEM